MWGMKPLPMPLRIAAGLAATAVEQAQELPRKITQFPVTAVSQALQVSMRLQQRVTELAIKGDRALGLLRPVPESPTWARFDEDEEPPPANGAVSTIRPRPAPAPSHPGFDHPGFDESGVPAPRVPTDGQRGEPDGDEPDGGPRGFPEYDDWTLAQVRARFRKLTLAELETLLAWETTHQDRPPFVTMLSNRIASVAER